jgi:hypothetical protein
MTYVSSDTSYYAPYASWDTVTISEMGPMIVVGSAKS